MSKIFKFIVAFFLSAAVSSCGGGGGGGGSESNESAPTGVRVLHAALDAAPIDIYSSFTVGDAVTSGYFAQSGKYGALSTGEQNLTLTLHNTPGVNVGSVDINVEKNQHYSVLFYGNKSHFGLISNLIDDNPGEIPDGMAAVKVVHGLVGASMLNVSTSGGQSIDNTEFGKASSYTFVSPGSLSFTVRRSSDRRAVASTSATLTAGQAYTILAGGEIDYFVVARVVED